MWCRLGYVYLTAFVCLISVRGRAPPDMPKICGAAAARGSANCAAMGGVHGRVCPSFLILGERKCGTSSLAQYALDHPHVLPPRQKECGFFSKPDRCSSGAPARDQSVYTANFPEVRSGIGSGPGPGPGTGTDTDSIADGGTSGGSTGDGRGDACMDWFEISAAGTTSRTDDVCKSWEALMARNETCAATTFDATATYLLRADPREVRALLPDARLVVLLRAPHRRAFSHFRMHQRFGYSKDLSFDTRVRRELALLPDIGIVGRRAAGGDRVRANRPPPDASCGAPALTGGADLVMPGLLYAELLRSWARVWGRERLLVLFQEEMSAASRKGGAEFDAFMARFDRHVGLLPGVRRPVPAGAVQRHNDAARDHSSSSKAPTETMRLLLEVYESTNRQLAEFLGRDLPPEWHTL